MSDPGKALTPTDFGRFFNEKARSEVPSQEQLEDSLRTDFAAQAEVERRASFTAEEREQLDSLANLPLGEAIEQVLNQ